MGGKDEDVLLEATEGAFTFPGHISLLVRARISVQLSVKSGQDFKLLSY